ncbi:mucin-like glycoprotein [Trypanosoma cruzi]|uniref:Uncharacterized protein n=1 Tax=Trypanosoma cruzi (strain CL Brener) TaxID=353153 RepID=Q4D648_TRYCC|nr:hypothetical protein Tc00.1047053509755.20 [Trypanosoma cruzi]EAN87996.1 hypothetical protein Tc00.1047053509755.20 [Trypanosoma cruzi]RNC39109.1 mucin-like glycoprotein [Trypanosoma cruzi]|eukprot:XP_809847.1 hypothetical protein [Trypanosoma cruzi strain CL Brener]
MSLSGLLLVVSAMRLCCTFFVRPFTYSAPSFLLLCSVFLQAHTHTQDAHCGGFECFFCSACWQLRVAVVFFRGHEEKGREGARTPRLISCGCDAPRVTALSWAPCPTEGGMVGNFVAASWMDEGALARVAVVVGACSVCVTTAGSRGDVFGDADAVVVPVDVSCAPSDGSLSCRVCVCAWKKCSAASAEAECENYTFSGFGVRMHGRNGELGAVCHVASAVHTGSNCAASCAAEEEGATAASTMNVTTHKYAGPYELLWRQFFPRWSHPSACTEQRC